MDGELESGQASVVEKIDVSTDVDQVVEDLKFAEMRGEAQGTPASQAEPNTPG